MIAPALLLALFVQDPFAQDSVADPRAELARLEKEFVALVEGDLEGEARAAKRAALEDRIERARRQLGAAKSKPAAPAQEPVAIPDDVLKRLAALEDRVAVLEGERAESASGAARLERAHARYVAARERLDAAEAVLVRAQREAGVVDVDAKIQSLVEGRRSRQANLDAAAEDEAHYEDLLEEAVIGLSEVTEGHPEHDNFRKRVAHLEGQLEDRRAKLEQRMGWVAEAEERILALIDTRATFLQLERAVSEARARYERAFEALLDAEDAVSE